MSLLTAIPSFALLIFSLWATADILLTPKEDIRNFHKIFWLVISVFFGAFTALSWLWVGRPRKVGFLPGGNTGVVAQLAANAGINAPARIISPTATSRTSGAENVADQSGLEALAPEATTVVDLTEPVDIAPAPLGPEDSPGWAEWSANAVADNQNKD